VEVNDFLLCISGCRGKTSGYLLKNTRKSQYKTHSFKNKDLETFSSMKQEKWAERAEKKKGKKDGTKRK
jgi:hypothetical protein